MRVVAGVTIIGGTCYAMSWYVPYDTASMIQAVLTLAIGLTFGVFVALGR